MEMAVSLLFSWLKGLEVFNVVRKQYSFKAKSSHLLLGLIKTSHNIKLTHIFQCNEIHLSLNIMNGTFLEYIETNASLTSLRILHCGIRTANSFA